MFSEIGGDYGEIGLSGVSLSLAGFVFDCDRGAVEWVA